jgi:hypothetical protein
MSAARARTLPLPSREKEGPIAQQWEGEGVGATGVFTLSIASSSARKLLTAPSPSHAFGAGPFLSRKGRGAI